MNGWVGESLDGWEGCTMANTDKSRAALFKKPDQANLKNFDISFVFFFREVCCIYISFLFFTVELV